MSLIITSLCGSIMDLSKIFDIFNHVILIDILECCRIHEVALIGFMAILWIDSSMSVLRM